MNFPAGIKNPWDGVLQWKRSRINNGLQDGLNSLIQVAKARVFVISVILK